MTPNCRRPSRPFGLGPSPATRETAKSSFRPSRRSTPFAPDKPDYSMIKNAFRYSALAFVLCARQAAIASEMTVTPLLDLRWRQEILDTLSANPALDHNYSYGNLRERFGGDVKYKFLTLHVLGQAADSYNVPNDASFGAGASYYSLSKNNSAPSQAALAELSLIARPNASS